MNSEHLRLCSSEEWAATVEHEILPWAIGAHDLGDDLLEIGPGPGLTTDRLRHLAPHLTAVEVDQSLADALRTRLAGSNVEVVHADAAALPLADARFSGATCFTMLHHVPSPADQDRLFNELHRVLRPGGVLVGVDSLPSAEWLALHADDTCVPVDPTELPARLTRAGFVDVEVELSQPRPSRRFRFAARAGLSPRG
ncbi:MAG: methyltransferase domain-containing protein [Chloroflexi bacterium]|nr:methyltransferase domain-containing protein [Chloroflexota bacterium]